MAVKASRVSDALARVREAERELRLAEAAVLTIDAQSPAVRAFAETLQEVLGDRALSVSDARRAALQAAAANVWEDAVGPLLDTSQARELLGGISRQRIDQLIKAGRLITLIQRDGTRRFPAWQFDDTGRPLPALVDAFSTLARSDVLSDYSAASWCTSPHRQLDGLTARQWVVEGHSSIQLELLASRHAARLAQ